MRKRGKLGFIVYDIYRRIPQGGAKVLNHNKTLTYPKVWTILKLARTIFSPPTGGEEGQKI